MNGSLTHLEIFGEHPEKLANFYKHVLGWQIEQMPGIDYWRIQIPTENAQVLGGGGLTYRSLPGLNSWLLHVKVASVDETTALVVEHGGGVVRPKTAVPRTAWVTIVADPNKNIFGIWQADPAAFPMPEPD